MTKKRQFKIRAKLPLKKETSGPKKKLLKLKGRGCLTRQRTMKKSREKRALR